ncbi:DUF1450 domain-containing protein [Alicyclobacillus herbarius]|uniref:DUF1450 domain-containing protein n=1 Tax=Alicyclobacillus herbarius TaxID=122960 RepID=UPI00040EC308|nr:DUF1450 domain-containing protein [Alicyclobacillus herbarius]
MPHRIEVCIENLELGSDGIIERIRATHPDVVVDHLSCTEQCELCARQPFIWLDDELVSAQSADDVWQALLHRLRAAATESPPN